MKIPSISNEINSNDNSTNFTYESILYNHLVSLMKILMKSRSSNTYHDVSTIQSYIHSGAITAIDHELLYTYNKLQSLQGINQNHQITSFSYLSTKLVNEIEALISNISKNEYNSMKSDQFSMKLEFQKIQDIYNEKVAKKVRICYLYY